MYLFNIIFIFEYQTLNDWNFELDLKNHQNMMASAIKVREYIYRLIININIKK